jgi:5-methylthioribose kinase
MPDALDIEDPAALVGYLRRLGKIGPDEEPTVRVLAGGVSNKTVLVERSGGESWVYKQALPKLRVSVDWFSDPARIHREAEALRWLPKLAPRDTITPLVSEDREHHLLAMMAVPQPHQNFKTILLTATQVDLNRVRQFGLLIGMIHRKAYERRLEVEPVFEDRSFFESLRVEPYYSYTALQISAAAPFLNDLVEETRAARLTLVHGDYSPKNVLVPEGGRIVLLDHEVIHWGDPAFDVGFALAHLLSKGNHRRELRGEFASASNEFWSGYWTEVRGMPWHLALEQWSVRHALGCLLARVAGRSPLEYLSADERGRQSDAAVHLMRSPPGTVAELVRQFLERV